MENGDATLWKNNLQLCGKSSCKKHACQTCITPRTKDGGFDVLAKFPLVHVPAIANDFFNPLQLYTKALGQAKCYLPDRPVGVDEVRELVGSFLIRLYTDVFGGKAISSIEDFFGAIRLCDPLLCLFLTTSYFSPQADMLARQCGIIPLNGKQIAAHLAIGNVGVISKGGAEIFDPDIFHQWILRPPKSKVL